MNMGDTINDKLHRDIMTPGDLINKLIKDAQDWTKNHGIKQINIDHHMNDFCGDVEDNDHNRRLVDAAIVSFINYVGSTYCMDVALYTKDLRPVDYFSGVYCNTCKHFPPLNDTEKDWLHMYGPEDMCPHTCEINYRFVKCNFACHSWQPR